MKFLIDGHARRCVFRREQFPDGVLGQLLTPLTRYRRGEDIFAIDNGAYSSFREKSFISLLKREINVRHNCLFVCVPDKVGCHETTLKLFNEKRHLVDGYKLAFVAQDGIDKIPDGIDALFIGGTTQFKDGPDVVELVKESLSRGLHVHIGRVNGPERFWKFHKLGAHTCDGSGVSRYDHMIEAIRDYGNK